MNYLIVDDELLAIELTQREILKMDDYSCKKDHIFTAIDIEGAKNIIRNEGIDLLFCDIEMPMGSGLDLIRWIYEQKIETECIMLTCYASFHYIKSAMKYGVVDYLLKPLNTKEFLASVEKAAFRIGKKRSAKKKRIDDKVSLYFREAYADSAIKQEIYALEPELKAVVFYPVLFSVKYRTPDYLEWDDDTLKFVMSNTINEAYNLSYTDILSVIDKNYLALLLSSHLQQRSDRQIRETANVLINWFKDSMGWNIACHVGAAQLFSDALNWMKESWKKDLVSVDYGVLSDQTFSKKGKWIENESIMRICEACLSSGKYDEFEKNIRSHLTASNYPGVWNKDQLKRFMSDIQQLLQIFLGKQHLLLSEFLDEQGNRNYENYVSLHSIDAALAYIRRVVILLKEKDGDNFEDGRLCEKVVQFINMHIDETLTREQLGNVVHLNPDYLNRMFKKETGMPLMEYVIDTKMKLAKRLLEETDLTIHAIGEHTGYAQYSYFATSFKKYVGLTPKEYRIACRKSKNEMQ